VDVESGQTCGDGAGAAAAEAGAHAVGVRERTAGDRGARSKSAGPDGLVHLTHFLDLILNSLVEVCCGAEVGRHPVGIWERTTKKSGPDRSYLASRHVTSPHYTFTRFQGPLLV
jgi:hypothetical protein